MKITKKISYLNYLPCTFSLILIACGYIIPTQKVHAEAGYRICAVFQNHGNTAYTSRGLVVKVAEENGGNTCQKKIAFMNRYYRNAYNETANDYLSMWQCESFSGSVGTNVDLCKLMEVNKIYKYTSRYGRYTDEPRVDFWTN
ncbi:hypothetical protein [Xanthomonas nasturtii]|uniref:hypothetical protein n=1 Tax=Xanthomonas nasturtii TaxID=1843581 RepID=UPI00201390E9|nr:hypothetical protein [Xanthomonas nasturtii]MCL1561795.1 hypothetical protein [Xanthomonas nasturtii]